MMRNTITELYQDKNGKDYLLKLKEESKRIIQIDLESGYISEFPFLTYRDAKANFKQWIKNSCTRLPKCFCINTSVYDMTFRLEGELRKLGLPFPEEIDDLKKFLVYHNNQYLILDQFDNNNIPEINLHFLKEVNNQLRIQKAQYIAKNITEGLFKGDVTNA